MLLLCQPGQGRYQRPTVNAMSWQAIIDGIGSGMFWLNALCCVGGLLLALFDRE